LPAGLKRYKKIINSCIPLYVMSWDWPGLNGLMEWLQWILLGDRGAHC
jgi:hypothetical protein